MLPLLCLLGLSCDALGPWCMPCHCVQAKFTSETSAGRRLQVVNTYVINGATL